MSGVPYHGWTHRPKSMGGTDPTGIEGAQLGYAHIQWNGSTVSIAANTWTNIDAAGAADFGEGFVSTGDPYGFTTTLTSGSAMIEWDGPSAFNYPLVQLTAWVHFSDFGFADGDEIGVGLMLGLNGTGFAAPRYINTIPIGGDDADIENHRVAVSVLIPGSFNKNSAKVNVWQSSAAAKTCGNVYLGALGLMDWAGTFTP